MKRSAGAPASICFASALLAPYETITLLPVARSNSLRLRVERFLEARRGEDGHVGCRDERRCRCETHGDERKTTVRVLSTRMRGVRCVSQDA